MYTFLCKVCFSIWHTCFIFTYVCYRFIVDSISDIKTKIYFSFIFKS